MAQTMHLVLFGPVSVVATSQSHTLLDILVLVFAVILLMVATELVYIYLISLALCPHCA